MTSRDVKRGLELAGQSAKNYDFFKEKQREYGKSAERAESVIKSKSGFGKELAHEKIVALKKELAMTESEILAPLRSAMMSSTNKLHQFNSIVTLRLKLESYRDLPPDVCLARVKVAEAEVELSALTNVLNQQINAMHV